MTNEPIIICNVILRAWFVRHRHYLERMKTFVLGFVLVFVLADDQAISTQCTTLKVLYSPLFQTAMQAYLVGEREEKSWALMYKTNLFLLCKR